MKVRIEQDHAPDCWAVEAVEAGDWESPWWFPGKRVRRDKNGQPRSTSYVWIVAECNSISCGAVAFVRESDLAEAVERAINGPGGDRHE